MSKVKKSTSRQILNRSSKRVTSQRDLLLKILRKRSGHLDASELYEQAHRKHPRLSLSTVYRNLQLFKKLGLVEEHRFADEHFHYETRSGVEHHHLLCIGCGEVIEFDCPVDYLRKSVSQKHDFKITGIEVRMTGLCPKCQGKK